MKTPISAIHLLFFFATSGCLHFAGQMQTVTTTRSSVAGSRTETVALPNKDAADIGVRFEGDSLVITATAVHWCRDDDIETISYIEKTETRMPPIHWALLGGGTLFGLAGTAGIACVVVTAPMIAFGFNSTLGTRQQEQNYDVGLLILPASACGALAIVPAILLLSSEVADYMGTGESEKKLAAIEKKTTGKEKVCEKGPAANVELKLLSADLKHEFTVKTDGNGRAVLPVLESELSRFPYDQPFTKIEYKGAAATPIDLPADLAAKLVVQHRDAAEMSHWLTQYPIHPQALDMKIMAAKVAKEEAEKYYQAAWQFLSLQRYEDARSATTKCLEQISGYKRCDDLRKKIDSAEVKELLQVARTQVANGSYLNARENIAACLKILPANKDCISLEQKVTDELKKPSPIEIPRGIKEADIIRGLKNYGFVLRANRITRDGTPNRMYSAEADGDECVVSFSGNREKPSAIGLVLALHSEGARELAFAVIAVMATVLFEDTNTRNGVIEWVTSNLISEKMKVCREFGAITVEITPGSPKVPMAIISFHGKAVQPAK